MCMTRTQGEIVGEIVLGPGHFPSDLPADTTPQAMRGGCINFGSPFAVVTEIASDLGCKFTVRGPCLSDIGAVCCVSRTPFPLNRGIMHAAPSHQMCSSRSTEPEPSVFLVDMRNDSYSNSTSPEVDSVTALSLEWY